MSALLSHTTPTESKGQRQHPDRFGFDWRPIERDINCIVYTSLPKRGLFLAFLPSAGVRESQHFVRCEMFFLRTHPERTSTSRVHNSEPFAVWLVGALDESDTSRTQVALDDYVG